MKRFLIMVTGACIICFSGALTGAMDLVCAQKNHSISQPAHILVLEIWFKKEFDNLPDPGGGDPPKPKH